MAVLRGLLLALAVLMVAMGLLWAGQGLGLILWPAESFMLADRKWALNGLALAVLGVILIGLIRRR